MIVLDTNVVSELVKPSPDPAVLRWFAGQRDAELVTATPVLAEVWSGVALLPQGRRATDIARALAIFLTAFEGRVWLLDERAAVEYAAIVGERRHAGRPVGVMDALIAAIARSRGAAVASRDVEGFRCDGLQVIDPWRTT